MADSEVKARSGAESLRTEHEAALRKGEAWEARATRGALVVQEARIEWLAEVRREIRGRKRG